MIYTASATASALSLIYKSYLYFNYFYIKINELDNVNYYVYNHTSTSHDNRAVVKFMAQIHSDS